MSASVSEVMSVSVSLYLGMELSKLCEGKNKIKDTLGNRVLLGVGFTCLTFLALIETVVRGILTVPAMAIYCCLPEHLKEKVWTVFPFGTAGSAKTVCSCCALVVGLICGEPLEG